jgi:hypothetical protein
MHLLLELRKSIFLKVIISYGTVSKKEYSNFIFLKFYFVIYPSNLNRKNLNQILISIKSLQFKISQKPINYECT